jgi:fimbrial isopeptide formation D2 family protein
VTRSSLSLCKRILSLIQSASTLFLLLILIGLGNYVPAAALQAPARGPKIWLQENQSLPVTHTGAAVQNPGLMRAAQPVSVTSGDIDADGVADLLVGYSGPGGGVIAVHRGNLDAFAPQSDASLQAVGRGEFPAPFLTDANTFTVPVSPDFIAIGNFTGNGEQDLVVAARGGNALYVFPGDGKGGFGNPQTVGLSSGVTGLAAGSFGSSGHFTTVLVGIKGVGNSSSLVALGGSFQGLKVAGTFPTNAAVSSIDFANFGGAGRDAAFLAGGQIYILRSSSMKVVPVSLPVSARAFALGSFIFDRSGGTQIAVLASDGSVQIAARSEFDPRTYTAEEFGAIRQAKVLHEAPPLGPLATFPTAWKIVDSFPGVGTLAAGQTPVFFRTRVSSNGGDDIMWLNAGNSQMAVISHPDVQPGSQTFAPGQVSIKPYTGSPINALPMRINIDGRPGVLAIHQGEAAPSMLMPIPDPTFFPNRFDDPVPTSPITNACNNVSNADVSSSCSLREAVLRANALAGTDTIQLAAGTYTLTIGRVGTTVPVYDANHGTLNINDSVNIVGAVDGSGNPASTITWGTLTSGVSIDMIMSVNEDINPLTNATASISNVIFNAGVNHGQHSNDGDGGCMEFDTGTSGNANLTLTNVVIQNCATLQGGGGGLVAFNFLNHNNNGFVTINNSTIQNNSAVDNPSSGAGGGIALSNDTRMVMTNSKVLNNLATQVIAGQKGQGGGIMAFFPNGSFTGNPETIIHSSTISGNKAAGFGGGMQTQARLLIDQGTVISNNVAGIDSTNTPVAAQDGGGLYINNFPPSSCPPGLTCDATLTHVTITGNTATGNGGGISNGNAGTFPNAAGPLTMTFSRVAGNSATGVGSNLKNGGTAITATDDWWGTNAAATTINTTGGGTTTFDPFIVLTHNATPGIIRINQSTTLTGDMSNDNHGTAVGLANLDRIIGLPITFDNPVLGSIPQAQPETLNASAQATATFNAGGTSGRGSAHATVDQAVVSANSNLIASATEAGTTATITTVGKHNFAAGETVVISGVGVAGYNGTFLISATPTTTSFTYTAGAGLAASSGGLANVGIIILEPLQIVKSFNPVTVAINAASTLTFSINNPNVIPVDASFTDTLPAGLVVAATPGVTNTCTGTVTAIAGSGSISYSNASLPIGACTITVKVSSATDNVYNNSVTINSTAAGTGALSTSSASLTVINPPTIAKAFGAATIPLNGTTSLTFTLSSTNANLTLNGVAFTDNLPAGLVVATPSNLNSTCSGTATAVAGSSSISLSGASLAPGASCTVSVDVQGTTAGVKNNSVQVTSTNAGTGNTSNASITVVAPPTIAKAFGAASIPLNGTTTLTFTINNPNITAAGDLTGVAFSDTLPVSGGPGSATLVVAAIPGVTNTCGGTVTATAGTGVISLSGAGVAHNASCTLSVNVTGTVEGDAPNTTGAITSTQGGTGTTSNTATLKVVAPPTISKAFGAAAITVNGTTTVTFTITDPASNTSGETGIAFSDTLTGGLQVASTPGVSNTCGGTVTAAANSTSISLTGGSIATPGATCTIVVNVTGTLSGTVTNTTGAVSSTNGGTGATSNTATLIVAAPPSITKQFGAASIPLNGTTSLTFTIQNPNTNITLNGIAFTDNLPAGLIVASTPNLSNTCGGTATATAGSGQVTLSAGTLASSASCTVSVNVQGTTAGLKNNSVQVTSTEGGTGNTSNASITVVGPPTIAKAFGAASIPLNGTTSVTFTISNPNATAGGDLTGVAFSDTLPVSGGPGSATLVVAATPGVTNTCGGTVTATAGTGVISLSGASVAHNASCTLSVNVTGTVEGDASNTTGAVSSTEGGTGTASNTALLKVVAPPTISKAFGAAAISLNGTTTVTFTITNPAANTSAENGIAFSDTLTNGLQVASTPGVSNTCGGTVTAAANSTSISLTGGSIATPGATCTIVVNVTGTQSGTVTNTTGAVSSTNGGTGATSNTATLIVASPASVTKQFGAASIPLNGTTSLTITITNPNTNVSLTGLSFTDNLPAGLVVATPSALNNTCGGTATATAGSGAVSLSGGTLAASASCTVSVNVQGTTAGVKNNSVQVTSTEGGTGNTSNASITVVGPPVIIKAFGAASIPLNGSTSLTFTIQNNNTTTALSGVAFSDTLPAGLVISTPNGLTGTCGAGTITATAGTNVISLSGGTIAASGSCTFSVNVTGTAAGPQTNTTGNVTSTEGGTGGTATASINVVAPPSIAKVFNPSSIALNATTSLTFTITNPAANTVALTGVAFTDTLPTGLTVANATSTVCGGTLTTTAPTGIALTGATIAANSQCQFSVTVTGAAAGNYTNTTGNVTSTNGGTGNTASANLNVATPPTITKSFGAASIPLNGSTSLSFTIDNPNTTISLTGIAFTDNLPAGLVVSTPNGLTGSCGGGTITAVAGSGSVSLSGATLAATTSCTFSVNVTGTTGGIKNNSVQVTATESGPGNTSNASITVTSPPVIIKAFGAASIPLNGSTSLTFTIQNNNTTVALTGVAFSDTLPAGLVISTPNGLTGSCGSGTITATQGTNVISLSGGTIAASASCTFSVNVTGTAAGTQNNTTGNVTSTEGGTGGTASASLNVEAPPSIAKVFNPSTIALNATTSLTFTITNPAANVQALTGVAFTDTLPTGLTVANASATVCGGTLTTTAPTGISLSGATINANSNCQFSVTVTGAAAGQYTNTTGNVSSTNGGTGNTASANLTVGTPPTISKAFGVASILLNASTSLTFNISNPNTNLPLTGVAFSDALPAGLVVATPNALTNSCGGTATAAAGSGSISLTGGTLAANASCTISLNVTGVQAGVQNNTTGPISSNESGAGTTSNTASITVIGPPSISKAFGAASIQLNAQTTLTFTITNPNATVALTGVGFGDTLPAGLAVANPNGLTGSCGAGTITTGTVSGFSVVNLSGGTIAAGGSCTFSVNVVGVTGGHKVNTTGTVTSSNAGSGNQATASIDVEAPDLTITKTHSGTFNRGQTGAQWTITVSNVGFGPTVGTVTVTDTLPNVTHPPVPTAISGTGWTCTLATLTCTRADALPSGSSYPPITLTVDIPQNIQNNFTNTATVSGGGDVNPNNNTATDKISLGPPIVITPQNSAMTVKAGSAAQFGFNVEDDDPTLGMVTFGCSGLPVGTACVFNPPATNQPATVVTMTITTSNGNSAVAGLNVNFGGKPPMYAALFFPVLGLVGIALTGRKARKTRLRFAMVFVGAAMLLSFAGCAGGLHGAVTPAGTYQITVTAASATVQASTPVTLNVQ